MRRDIHPFTSMTNPIINLPVYDPAGRDVLLSENDLLQHMLVIGATGSGKTALLHRIIAQMISCPNVGLLIFDPKQDDTVQRVKTLARAVGRIEDVVVLGPDGDHYVNLFGNRIRCLADVDATAARLLLGSGPMGHENAFWDEARLAMFDAALSLLVVQGKRVNFSSAINFMRQWFFTEIRNDHVLAVVTAAESIAEKMTGPEKQKLLQALDTVAMWKGLDPRTRSNILSTLTCAVRPLLSLSAARCFQSYGRKSFDVAEVAKNGRVCVVSLNAIKNPSVASLFFRVVKSDFFRAVQNRNSTGENLCGLVADEWPLIATAEDVDALATVRSRGCFVAAATQGLSILDERLGTRMRKALLANFGTVVFMRTREEETDVFAAVHLGTTTKLRKTISIQSDGDLISQKPARVPQEVLVCPPGTLGRLLPHQGFVALPGSRCEYPLSFVPWFEEEKRLGPVFQDPSSPERLKRLLAIEGFAECVDTFTFRKALHLCAEGTNRDNALASASDFFRSRAVLVPKGLETLPTVWLLGLPGILWSTRRPEWIHLPYMIRQVEVADGLLQLRFAQEAMTRSGEERTTAWDRLRLLVNASLYPSRWRPLKPEHERIIRVRWPELNPVCDGPDVG